ncbi:MAG: hypothetical protein VX447_13035 [Pseudomonadota bacterium]|uniref:hypothetical protein n=1 Tax=Gallaecimonas pentaromativorans TaxID=584787 RepID=UPI00067F1FA0|nr:hypothetical protein [Gallaecimonas pentaromativorans]MED5525661.1 hypothetical protein [Pseudomonadota bacterium]
MAGLKNVELKIEEKSGLFFLYCSYSSSFRNEGVTKKIAIPKEFFLSLFKKIKEMLEMRSGGFSEFFEDYEAIVTYGGRDYQPIIDIVIVKGESVDSVPIPEKDCFKLIESLGI